MAAAASDAAGKEEPPVKEEPTEEDQAIKEEEMKEELKEEVKGEEDAVKQEDEAGEDTGKHVKKEKKEKKDKKDKKDKKEKKEKDGEKADDESEEGSAVAVDLTAMPQAIIIEESGKKSVDGKYKLLPQHTKGKPAYELQNGKKPMFLYFDKKWFIGQENAKKKTSVMSLMDVGLPHPCEPYPDIWRRNEKNEDGSHSKVAQPQMRVYDAIFEEENTGVGVLAATLREPAADGAAVAPSPSKRRRKEKAEVAPAGGEDVAIPGDGDGGKTSAASSAAAASKSEAPKAAPAEPKLPTECNCGTAYLEGQMFCGKCGTKREMVVKQEDVVMCKCGKAFLGDAQFCQGCGAKREEKAEEAESEAESSEESSEAAQGTDSDSDSSSSSAPSKLDPPPQPKALPPPPTLPAAQSLAMQRHTAAELFKTKMRERMATLKGCQVSIKNAIAKVKDGFNEGHTARTGLTWENVESFLKELELEMTKRPKQPPAPPPRHLIKPKAGAPVVAAMPETTMPHRMMQAPIKSKLRAAQAKWLPKSEIRISFPPEDAVYSAPGSTVRAEVQVKSWRAAGETLWFSQPGAIVTCDDCGNTGPQTNGCLQGSEGKSQFAQSKFVCMECIGTQQANWAGQMRAAG